MSTPMFRIGLGGSTLTGPNDRLLECTVVDQEGKESDSATITLDDRDATLEIPSRGKELSIAMGYRETGLYPMGKFIVDEVKVSGWPRQMVIEARAADLREEFKQGRTQDYHGKTLKDIIGEIAGRHALDAKVQGTLAGFKYGYIAQTEESDMAFMTRLGVKHDAIAKPTNGVLAFTKKGEGESASGLGMGTVNVTYPGNLKSYEKTFKDRPRHEKSQGSWWDKDKAERVEEEGKGTEGPKYQLPPLWPDGKEEAKESAQAQSDKMARDGETCSFVIIGDPDVMAEVRCQMRGVRPGVDGTYRIKTATHTINASGYETEIECELPGSGGA